MVTTTPEITPAATHRPDALRIPRRFTQSGRDPFASVTWAQRTSRITNPDGTVVFEMADAEIPASWSQVATDIMVSKYFRKAGVPQTDNLGQPVVDASGNPVLGPERSAKQVILRLAATWRWWGETNGYFASSEDADAFQDEMAFMLVNQMAAPNSPQWFNTGLAHAYGITGPAQGHYYVDPADTTTVRESDDAYTRPQPHACQPAWATISTPHGPMMIGDIVRNGLVGLEVFDGTDDGRGTTTVLAVKDNGHKRVFRIMLKNGAVVDATADHLVFAVDDRRETGRWLQVDQIVPGMRMQLSTTTQTAELGKSTNVAEAALAGWLQGDGFVGQYSTGTNQSLTVEAMTVNDEEFQYVSELIAQVWPTVHSKVRLVETMSTELTVRRIRLYGEVLRPFVERYELLRESPTDELSIPVAVLSAGHEAHAAYLRSLFQADGSVRLRVRESVPGASAATVASRESLSSPLTSGHLPTLRGLTGVTRTADVVLTTVSSRLAHDVQTLLLNMGIYARLSEGRDKRSNRRPAWQVSIGYAEARRKYAELVGFVSEDKIKKLDRSCSVEFAGKQLPALREEQVIGIEDIGVHPVFDIQTASQQYLSNNVLVHNCFIQSVSDDLVNDGGIMDLWIQEARLFKYGSGTGTNFSHVRGSGEALSGGGTSSGLMSFLRVGDRAAGAIKSGGTTRRAAKMVVLNADHPDIEAFIDWKPKEELKVAAMVEGMKHLSPEQQARAEELGLRLTYDYNGEAYETVSGQNSNNSVRLTNDFILAVQNDADWDLTRRTDGTVMRTIKARDLWNRIAEAAWHCADPGVQFDTTINEWHTSPAGGRINASNPCSEYMFLDNTACNLASLNVLKFLDADTHEFQIDDFRHAVRLWTVVLEISVLMAQFPSPEIARLSYDYRTLGLGYANIGTVLMILGLPYDSDAARAYTGVVTALMTGESYATSAELASVLGPFPEYEANAPHMLRVIRNHRRATHNAPASDYEGLTVPPMAIDAELAPSAVLTAARDAWDRALQHGEEHGYRNAQTTLLAPTGTIGLLMDCDTTGVEPDFALVKFKKLAGGGYFKIANGSLDPALVSLGYDREQRRAILTYVLGTLSLEGAPHINRESLLAKGLNVDDLRAIEAALPATFELPFAFSAWSLGEGAIERLGLTMDEATRPGFDLLRAIGFTRDQIDEANEVICGTMTIEGAPHLREEHYPVFDTANKSGKKGTRLIHHSGHIRMMAAAQSFLSGAISKTINMPHEATIADVEEAYRTSWELGVKAMAIYRDGSKMSQPLSSKSDTVIDLNDEQVQARIAAEVEAAVAAATATKDAEIAALTAQLTAARQATPTQAGPVNGQTQLPGMPYKPVRRKLPAKRHGFTQEARIAGHKIYLRTGEYEDGTLGEIFIDMHKEGAAFRSMINSFAIAVSKGLQYGVPLEEYVDTYTFVRFEPQGMVAGHPNIKLATSVIDFVFRVLGMEYLGRTDLVQVADPPRVVDQTGEHSDLLPSENDIMQKSPAQRIASPAAPSIPTTNGNQHVAPQSQPQEAQPLAAQTPPTHTAPTASSAIDAQLGNMMGDAPFCDVCGHITVRNGACYKCLNCGNSLGCS